MGRRLVRGGGGSAARGAHSSSVLAQSVTRKAHATARRANGDASIQLMSSCVARA